MWEFEEVGVWGSESSVKSVGVVVLRLGYGRGLEVGRQAGGGLVKRKGWMEDVDGFGQWEGEG